jgi:CopG family transcriptional regulator/antitoxin EndoAI
MMAKPTPANRIIFTAPPSLLEAVDHAAHSLNLSRSELIRLALERFLAEQQRSLIRASLIEAYQAYAHSSVTIAEEFFASEQDAWDQYAP